MKKLFGNILMLFAFTLPVLAQEEAVEKKPDPNAPDMVFEKELHDFGTVEHAGNGTYEFKFVNKGKQPLIISNAQGSCGCTVPQWPKEPIVPGASGSIKVTYDTKRVGAFTKTVTISSNAKTATKVLTIKGTVSPAPTEETSPFKKTESGMPFEK